ncbi:MAG TPA: hydroxyisourate hydrolase [Candidatus Dormibacteraeota bacterium]
MASQSGMNAISVSTHVLHLGTGRPAAGIEVELVAGDELVSGRTDVDGRLRFEGPLPRGPVRMTFSLQGQSELFRSVTLDLDLDAAGHHHIPLLLSPYGVTTYRGS